MEAEHTTVIDDVVQATKVESLGREEGGAGREGLIALTGGASNSSDGDDVGNSTSMNKHDTPLPGAPTIMGS
jgi:hypothetical protein